MQLPISDILVTIPLIGQNELADSPLLRGSFLDGLKNVVIDSTLSGVNADGEAWVGSPVLNASGYVDLIPRSIDQLLTNGGSITLSGNQVMTASGSSLNLDGGFVHYLGGMINTTRVIDAYGQLESIGNADPNIPIIGIAGQFTVDHSHWNVTQIYSDPLLSGGSYEPDYIVGGNAGTLNIFGSQATVLDGAMSAQAFAGVKQIEAGLAPSGTNPGGNFLPEGGSFNLGAASALAFPTNDTYSGQPGFGHCPERSAIAQQSCTWLQRHDAARHQCAERARRQQSQQYPGLDDGAGGAVEQWRVRQCHGDGR